MRIKSKYLSCLLALSQVGISGLFFRSLFSRFLRKKTPFDLCCKLRLVFIKRLMCPKGWVGSRGIIFGNSLSGSCIKINWGLCLKHETDAWLILPEYIRQCANERDIIHFQNSKINKKEKISNLNKLT